MVKRYIQNDTQGVLFVGGTMVPAGEGREVDEEFLPPTGQAPEASFADLTGLPSGALEQIGRDPAASEADLAALLNKPIKSLLPLIADANGQTLAELSRLEGLRETPRTTLLATLGEMALQAAQDQVGAPT